ncbi:MAG TPA: NADH-quinone oxidoreductase subunit L [Roseiflexaceae bacterium]|nr:NADH-quinone oxidoreductase subunit L [Roseiflexaceae bacterium]
MSNMTWIVTLIPAFPLLGFLLNTFFVRRGQAAGAIASAAVVLSFLTTLGAIAVLQAQPVEPKRIDFFVWEWIAIGNFRVPFGFLFDQLTAVMALLVTGVGAIIHIYSIGYMRGDERPVRFFAAMNLFIVSMLCLIMADNLLLLFLGWEGVGLCSFLLIGHYFDRKHVAPDLVPSGAAVKAFVVNRVGDLGLLLAMFAIFSRMGSLSFYTQSPPDGSPSIVGFLERLVDQGVASALIDLGAFGSIGLTTAICLLLLLGVAGKSAQLPLYVWLPDAMAGPTPVSALIHAATMVTSGVYLIARTEPLFNTAIDEQGWVVAIGVLTALIGAFAALAQFDIKRVLAYSTISQLGYMIAAVGMGAVTAGMFHLLTHGVFKALLFLAAGAIIHGTHETQDMRRMGGLRESMPRTYRLYLVGALALAGIFPFGGFWSKDEIIAHAFAAQYNFTGVLLIFASMVTAFYMGRQIALIFFGKQRDTSYHAHDSEPIMHIPLVILAVGTLLIGVINLPGLHWLADYLAPVTLEGAEEFSLPVALITLLLSIGMGYLGWWLYSGVLGRRVRPGKEDPAYYYLGDIWTGAEIALGLDWLYQNGIVRPYRVVARFLSDVFDREGIDGVLVEGTGGVFARLGQIMRGAQSGYVRNYVLVFLFGVVLLVGYFALRS